MEKTFPSRNTHNRRQVLVEYQISTSSGVIQGERDTMSADQNVFEREGQSITHDELCTPNNGIHTLRFP